MQDSQPSSSFLDLGVDIVSDAEFLRQDMMNVPSPMQDVQYLDPVRTGLVENEIILEAGDRKKAELGQDGMIGFVAGTEAGLCRQKAKGCLGCVEEAECGTGAVLLDVIRPAFQVAQRPVVLDDSPLLHPLLRSSGLRS